MGKTKITLVADTPSLRDVAMSFFINYKQQFAQYLKLTLEDKGERADLKVHIKGDVVELTSKSGDKGLVIQSAGIGFQSVGYDTLQDFEKYMVMEDGLVKVYVKMPDGVDAQVAGFKSLNEAIENIHANEIEDLVKSLRKPFEKDEPSDTGETTIEAGNTQEAVQGVQPTLRLERSGE
jgi:hypothetical protein